jgi:hypothetical protein
MVLCLASLRSKCLHSSNWIKLHELFFLLHKDRVHVNRVWFLDDKKSLI